MFHSQIQDMMIISIQPTASSGRENKMLVVQAKIIGCSVDNIRTHGKLNVRCMLQRKALSTKVLTP